MILPDAKCVVNGPKVNECINAINALSNIGIVVGNVDEPQIQYAKDGVLIVLPKGSSYTNEELSYVNQSNQSASAWFVTSATQGMTPVNTNTSPVNKQNTSTPTGREQLNGGRGAPGSSRSGLF